MRAVGPTMARAIADVEVGGAELQRSLVVVVVVADDDDDDSEGWKREFCWRMVEVVRARGVLLRLSS